MKRAAKHASRPVVWPFTHALLAVGLLTLGAGSLAQDPRDSEAAAPAGMLDTREVPEAVVEPGPEPEPESQASSAPESASKPEPEATPVLESTPVVEPEAGPVLESTPVVEPEATPVLEPAPQAEPEATRRLEAAPEPAPEPAPPIAVTAVPVEVMPEGDVERGRLLFGACRACHYLRAGEGHHNGPNLHRIFGRVVGTAAGFEYYSESFRTAGFAWTPERLFAWLANPLEQYPETTMMSPPLSDPQRRADLIAYLARASVLDP